MRMLKPVSQALGLVIATALLAACASNGVAKNPGVTQANLAANKLQFAVGTARIGQDGTVGVNFVSTLRQPNGLSGPLADSPRVAGRPGSWCGLLVAAGAYSFAGAETWTPAPTPHRQLAAGAAQQRRAGQHHARHVQRGLLLRPGPL